MRSDPDPVGASAPSSVLRLRDYAPYVGLLCYALAVPVLAEWGRFLALSPTATTTAAGLSGFAFAAAVYRARLTRLSSFARLLVVVALVLAVGSIVFGFFGGSTDEPAAMPVFIQPILHGQDPYATPVAIDYEWNSVLYGATHTPLSATYSYLPFLLFFQPFLVPYKWFALATWAVTVYLVRSRPMALVAIGQPYMALLSANGFNDFPALLLLTLALVGVAGSRRRWAEYLALGCKQFANFLVLAYYLIARDWRSALVTLGVSLAWVLPFLVWNPSAFLYRAVFFAGVGSGTGGGNLLNHVNYWAWPIWALGVYFGAFRRWYHAAVSRITST